MTRAKTFGIVSGIIVAVVAIISVSVLVPQNNESDLENETGIEVTSPEVFVSPKSEWITSGPFQIDRPWYRLGDTVFLRVHELPAGEKGEIAFLRLMNETHYQVYTSKKFDGSITSGFNFYFRPDLSVQLGICTKDDLVGKWKVVFRGVPYESINFEFIDKVLPGSEEIYDDVFC